MRTLEQWALSIAANASRIHGVSVDECSVSCSSPQEAPTYFAYRTLSSGNSSCACPGAKCTIVYGIPNSTVFIIPKVTANPTLVPTPAPATSSPTNFCRQQYKVGAHEKYRSSKHVATVYMKVSNLKKLLKAKQPFEELDAAGLHDRGGKDGVADTVEQLALQIKVPSGFVFWKGKIPWVTGVRDPRFITTRMVMCKPHLSIGQRLFYPRGSTGPFLCTSSCKTRVSTDLSRLRPLSSSTTSGRTPGIRRP